MVAEGQSPWAKVPNFYQEIAMLYPLTFLPRFKERVWGGRKLEQLYGKKLPAGAVIGESWEISDRPGDVSVVANGPVAGKDLQWLLQHHRADLMGEAQSAGERFPLLIKLLDAQEKLSLQVHPPRARAAELGGEPKTEMWYIAEATPDAELFVGLKRGCTRQGFEEKLKDGTVADCFHRLKVKAGDAMFLPSGRVHAIGAGLVIFEVQQNSDTTYRVFDWNRVGLDGKPRALHLGESLASIDFGDFEPGLVAAKPQPRPGGTSRLLVQDPLFEVEEIELRAGGDREFQQGTMQLIGVVSGNPMVTSAEGSLTLAGGEFCLLPASLKKPLVRASAEAKLLRISVGSRKNG
jgi:mannose-6-phosphate isomerase